MIAPAVTPEPEAFAFYRAADRMLPARLAQWKREIAAAALAFNVDPLLLAAVMDRESLGGEALKPKGPAGTGDFPKGWIASMLGKVLGHGRGLMQVDDRWHRSFVAATFDGAKGTPLWAIPAFSILYGAALLARNLKRFGDDVPAALCAYNAGPDDAAEVLALCDPQTTLAQRIAMLDARTARGSYVSSVLARRAELASL